MTDSYSDAELDAFLDESLSAELMSAIEKELRDHEPLRNRLVEIIERRDQGSHTVGAIWRRHRRGRWGGPTRGATDGFPVAAQIEN